MDYDLLCEELAALTEGVSFALSNLSNASALLYDRLPRLNWAGVYLFADGKLRLGPFQGKPACVEIAPGRGVCGTAFAEDRTVRVEDVHAFPGHIACDAASRSEIVIPLRKAGVPMGVLDLDSPDLARFTEQDRVGLEVFAALLEQWI